MPSLRGQLTAAIVVAAGIAFAVFLATGRPAEHQLPYGAAVYTASDAARAFAAEGIRLTRRSHTRAVTTLGNPGDVLEVDTFGTPERVERTGFRDTVSETCGAGNAHAERWRANVRVVVSCTAGPHVLRRVERALARL